MTETLGQPDIGSRLYAGFQRFCAFLGKAGFGVFLLAAAIFTLLAATFIGLMLAIAAVFLSFARPKRRAAKADEQTLEARRTADGWVIEL
jgi:uncharacterized membrane protein